MEKLYNALYYFYNKYGIENTFIIGDCYMCFANIEESELVYDFESKQYMLQLVEQLFLVFNFKEELDYCYENGYEVSPNYTVVDFSEGTCYPEFEVENPEYLNDMIIKSYESETLSKLLENSLDKNYNSDKKLKV